MTSADEPISASLDAPTVPLMGTDSQQLKDESRHGDRLALYTAFVCYVSQLVIQTPTPD